MLTTPWKKVLIDLWEHRMRTLIVALAIAVGVYAVGVVLNTREILVREYHSDQAGAQVASAVLYTQPFDDDLAANVAKLPLIAAAEGRSLVRTRVYPDGKLPQDLVLVSVPNFSQMQVNAVTPLQGAWPPGRREIVLERLSLAALGAQIGQEITVELDNGAVRTLKVAGSVHDPAQVSPDLAGATFGYVTPETLVGLGFPDTYTELRIRATAPAHDEQHILAALTQVEDQLKSSGRTILSREVITRTKADRLIDTVVLILTGFGVIILLLSGFLVVNAMSALITQQIPQIGVMKLIGARRRQIIALYLATVLVYGVLFHFLDDYETAWRFLRGLNGAFVLGSLSLMLATLRRFKPLSAPRQVFLLGAFLFSGSAIITCGWFANVYDASALILIWTGLFLLAATDYAILPAVLFGLAFFCKESAVLIFPFLLTLSLNRVIDRS